jgi:hypothetical protein
MTDDQWLEQAIKTLKAERSKLLSDALKKSPSLHEKLQDRLLQLDQEEPPEKPTDPGHEPFEVTQEISSAPSATPSAPAKKLNQPVFSGPSDSSFLGASLPNANQSDARLSEASLSDAGSASSKLGLGANQIINDRYRLTKKIGEGGMGSVWIAEQTKPVRRQVAIKLIRAGRESHQIIKRFEQERQALAIMDHPGIARVLDGGTTEEDQPWFAMELVDGVPLTDYCDRVRLSLRSRLELFIHICQAVQHAHQKGVIHRDLKPGNILVTLVDGRPVPKVIDFGLARATEARLVDESLDDANAIVGTPVYMSPEQTNPESMDVDTRADVYALGVILYELIVGTPPISAQEFQRGGILEMLRMVREVDPPRPSTRLSSIGNLPNIAAQRALEPSQLQRWIRGDIEWVTMKALEKERDRRYDSPMSLANDLQRFLQHEPVAARPPSRWYKLQKFLRRNRVGVFAASLIALAVVAGLAGTTWGFFEARKQQRLAQIAAEREKERAEGEAHAKQLAQQSAEAERTANELTQKRLLQIQAGNELVFGIFRDLDIRRQQAMSQPIEAVLADRLVEAGQKIDDELVGDPLTTANLLHRLGTVSYTHLTLPTKA